MVLPCLFKTVAFPLTTLSARHSSAKTLRIPRYKKVTRFQKIAWNGIHIVGFLNFKGFSNLPNLLETQELGYIGTQEHKSLFLFWRETFDKVKLVSVLHIGLKGAKTCSDFSHWTMLMSLKKGWDWKKQITMLFGCGVFAASARLGLGVTQECENSLVYLTQFDILSVSTYIPNPSGWITFKN